MKTWWVHGTRLGREHKSLKIHLREDHGVRWERARSLSDGEAHGTHDGMHDKTWAYAYDLPHPNRFVSGERALREVRKWTQTAAPIDETEPVREDMLP